MLELNWHEVHNLAYDAAHRIDVVRNGKPPNVYAIPRGGILAAMAISKYRNFNFVDDIEDAHYIVDDLIDSGATMKHARALNPQAIPIVLLDKHDVAWADKWIVFPWERNHPLGPEDIQDNIRRILQCIDPNPTRAGLAETPERVAKAWKYWTSGYGEDPATILKTFDDGAEKYDEMVLEKHIPFYSQCEHHLAPFFGTATVAYVPSGRIVGLSKIVRLVECFARRLQVQERMTVQIADALMEHLEPRGVGVILKARHLCMESRGVRQAGVVTTTSALRGVFVNEDPRKEFLALHNGG